MALSCPRAKALRHRGGRADKCIPRPYPIRAMTKEPIQILRGMVTLVCLVGVPAIALVGIRAEKPAAANGRPTSPPESSSQLPSSNRASTQPPAVPTATIRTIAAAGDSPVDDSRAADELAATSRAEFHDRPAPDLMTQQFQRLQALGATYYRLEIAPDSAPDFWFHCRVAGIDRPFGAADAVATNAIAQVLAEIEALGDRRTTTAASPSSAYRR
jgi:hypothetical protein